MLATMLIEFGLAAYTLLGFKMTRRAVLTVAGLLCLGTFQLAEYLICERTGIDGLSWARIGHVAISLLPPIGISLGLELAGKRCKPLEAACYLGAIAFIGYYGFGSGAISASTCQGNYVIFAGERPLAGALYGLYYFGLLAVGTYIAFHYGRRADKNTRRALYGLMIGYLTFIIPTTVIYLLDPSVTGGIPSIMCGFAVFLALMIGGVVMPHGNYTPRDWRLYVDQGALKLTK